MGKKLVVLAADQRVLTLKEQIRHASNVLQRHIFNKNSQNIKKFLDQNLQNNRISFKTHDKFMDILRETKKQAQDRENIKPSDYSQAEAEDQDNPQIHKQVSLQDEFEAMLQSSMTSYEKTYDLFKRMSLRQKHGHLIGNEQTQQSNIHIQELTEQESRALKKIKILYRKYRVSNMYKRSIQSKVRVQFIQRLLQKGYLKQKDQIISLAS